MLFVNLRGVMKIFCLCSSDPTVPTPPVATSTLSFIDDADCKLN